MKVTMLLADAAQAADGKLYVLGGGWSICGPAPTPMALAIKIEVPWDQANVRHHCRIELVDGDGVQILVSAPDGSEQPLVFETDFEVGRPPGLKPGTSIDLPLAINIPPVPLPPAESLQWRLAIDDETDHDWVLAFRTRPNDAVIGGTEN
jgi:hypothetical protein